MNKIIKTVISWLCFLAKQEVVQDIAIDQLKKLSKSSINTIDDKLIKVVENAKNGYNWEYLYKRDNKL